MYISAQAPSSPSLEIKDSKTKKTVLNRNVAVNVGAALLFPAVAVGSFIFGLNESSEPSSEPYKSEIKLAA